MDENKPNQENYRNFKINVDNHDQIQKFCDNYIKTSKYTWYFFLPKFLFEQFRKASNLFFLFVAILQQIPGLSPVGRYATLIPLSFVLTVSLIKELIEDIRRSNADRQINSAKCTVLKSAVWSQETWSNIRIGNIILVKNDQFFPADLILLSSSEENGTCYIETSSLDGETNYKIKQSVAATKSLCNPNDISLLKATVKCETPNKRIYNFFGTMEIDGQRSISLNNEQILLRGCRLRNTQWIIGSVVYTGKDAKIMRNMSSSPIKRSKMDRMINYFVVVLLIILVIFSLGSALTYDLWLHGNPHKYWYLGIPASKTFTFHSTFVIFFILYHNIIPISLTITLEVVKFMQAFLISWDLNMYHNETDTPALPKTSSIIEDLGQITYIFSDKTGTLTENIMTLKKISVSGLVYGEKNLIQEVLSSKNNNTDLENFMLHLSLCHCIVPEFNNGDLIYQSSSPDETALVKGVASLGYIFYSRKGCVLEVRINGISNYLEVLNVLEFTSVRKRMSVIVKNSEGLIKILTKGADVVILNRLSNNQLYKEETFNHIEAFAKEGFRTLCIAENIIDPYFYEKWNERYYKATVSLVDREKMIEDACNEIEVNLKILGATAIEDKLQDGVSETINCLIDAGIKIWMLTGDRLDTAINIGVSTSLIRSNTEILIIDCTSEECYEWLNDQLFKKDIKSHESLCKKKYFRKDSSHILQTALIVPGDLVDHLLDSNCRIPFLNLSICCKTVICCRVSPNQKSRVVSLINESIADCVTLAVGDGGNDVSMIQTANVGVGISGLEGMQAVNASDFAIAQFRFLRQLILVHGSVSYQRLAQTTFFCIYKNVIFYLMEFLFTFYNLYSGQVLFSKVSIALYNVVFTALPPFCFGLFDRPCSMDAHYSVPQLYRNSQHSHCFNFKIFMGWFMTGIVHMCLIFFMTYFSLNHSIVSIDGRTISLLGFGSIIFTIIVLTVLLKAAIELKCWNWPILFCFGVSVSSWFSYISIFSRSLITNVVDVNFLNIDLEMYYTPVFWFLILVIPFLCIVPDLTFHITRRIFYKSAYYVVQEAEKTKVNWANQSVQNIVKNEITKTREIRNKLKDRYMGFAFSSSDKENININSRHSIRIAKTKR